MTQSSACSRNRSVRAVRLVALVLLLFSVAAVCQAYDLPAAGLSALGSAGGAYLGQTVAVPVVILCHKAGIIRQDPFSPFSNVLYTAMDVGSFVGNVVGGVLVKHIWTKEWDLVHLGIDAAAVSACVLGTRLAFRLLDPEAVVPSFVPNIIIAPCLGGIYLGWEWSSAGQEG